MANNLKSEDSNGHLWLNDAISPPAPFDSPRVSSVDNSKAKAGLAQDCGVQGSDAASKPTDAKQSASFEDETHDATMKDQSPKKATQGHKRESTKSSQADVEIIGHINGESKIESDEAVVPTFDVAHPNRTSFSRNGIIRTRRRQNGVENLQENGVETLTSSDEHRIDNQKRKTDRKHQKAMRDQDMMPQDDNYASDDSIRSASSSEETATDFEDVSCPADIMDCLAEPDFDVWRLGRDGMVDHLEYMYHGLGITRAWRIPRLTLRMFLLGVRERYQDNPYHNFKHCFCVAQMAFSMICKLNLRRLLSVDDVGMLLTAAICHDVDHPGLNNGYQAHAHSPLAILYDYRSILEQHHFAVTCRILTSKEKNIFRNVAHRDKILKGARELILATDLALHKDIMDEYKKHVQEFDFKNRSHVLSLLKIIIKCADVSNEVRPEGIATPWVERLFSEYHEQSAREKRESLPVTAYMDPDKVDVTDSQQGFIKGMMLPMYDELARLTPDAEIYYVNPLKEALLRYELQKREEISN